MQHCSVSCKLGVMPGIEVRSTESRCEAHLIEVRSTKAFLLNWGYSQTWLGQLLVELPEDGARLPLRREYKRLCMQKSTPLGVLAGVNSL